MDIMLSTRQVFQQNSQIQVVNQKNNWTLDADRLSSIQVNKANSLNNFILKLDMNEVSKYKISILQHSMSSLYSAQYIVVFLELK